MAYLLRDIEAFLKREDMTATRFGRTFRKDPRFVGDLRDGRIPRPATEAKIRADMAKWVK